MNKQKTKILIITLIAVLIVLILGVAYVANKNTSSREAKNKIEKTGPTKEEMMKSVTAPVPVSAEPASIDKEFLNSITAKNKKESGKSPVSQEIFDSISAK